MKEKFSCELRQYLNETSGPAWVRTYLCPSKGIYMTTASLELHGLWEVQFSEERCVRKGEKSWYSLKSVLHLHQQKQKKSVWKIIILYIVEKLYRSTRMRGIKTLVPYHLVRNYPSKQHHRLGAKHWPIPQNSILRDICIFPLLIFVVYSFAIIII